MAFENVNVNNIRSALNKCKLSIDYGSIDLLLNNLNNNKDWNSASKQNLINAINSLKNNRFRQLEHQINTYLTVLDQMDSYQEKARETEYLKNQCEQLNKRMYVKDDNNGRSIDYEVKGKINEINARIANNNDALNKMKLDILGGVDIPDDMITKL